MELGENSYPMPGLKIQTGEKKKKDLNWVGISLVVQWLRFWVSYAGGPDSIPGQETEIPRATTKN